MLCQSYATQPGPRYVLGKSDNGQQREEIPALTGLRFVAAFSVLIGHGFTMILINHETPWGAIYWIRQSTGFGMTLFFVLSGFVIHYNYATLVVEGGRRGIAIYLWARFARLYPLFALMMFVYVLINTRTIELWSGYPERFYNVLQALPYFLTSMHSWMYLPIDGVPLIGVIGSASSLTWSISTEWFFYLIYPGIAWLVLRLRGPWIIAAMVLLWCICWMAIASNLYDQSQWIDEWAVVRYGVFAGVQNNPEGSFVRWLLYFSPYLRIGEFVLGTLVAQLYIRLLNQQVSSRENVIGNFVVLIATGSIFLVTYLEYGPNITENIFRKLSMNFALAPSVALIVFGMARYRNIATRMLTSRLAISLGDASYSIYLVHFVGLLAVVKAEGSARSLAVDVVKLVFIVAAVLLISRMLFICYEDPARKWLRRLLGNGRRLA